MNQKKCPKCGELNPQEAVMCWACYTPLAGESGGVRAATATARGPAPAAQAAPHRAEEKEEKKSSIAPWLIGLVVAALLIAGGFGFMMMSGGSEESSGASNVPVGNGTGIGGIGTGIRTAPPRITGLTMPSGPSSSVPMPKQPTNVPQFRMTTGPSRNSSWATIGIVPNASVSGDQAIQMARNARTQITNGRNFTGVSVFVFTDSGAASTFQNYQKSRRGAPLDGDDYASLPDLWQKTLLRYEFSNGKEDVRTPNSGGDWWSRGN